MILTVNKGEPLDTALDQIGLGEAVKRGGSLLIKINLAHPPAPGHPRTDAALLREVLTYALEYHTHCAIAEGADGFLLSNLASIGLADFIRTHRIEVLDLDKEPFDEIRVDDEVHYLPRCLKDYAVRLAIPTSSRRPGMTFSNNVKLFVGAVPRHMYQNGPAGPGRPRVHAHLHRSIGNIYRAIMEYSPFSYYVNGGKAMFEATGEIDLANTLIGNDALELDCLVLRLFGIPPPEYFLNLSESNP